MADTKVIAEVTGLLCASRASFFASDGGNDEACVGNGVSVKQRQREEEKRVHELVYALCEGEAVSLVTSAEAWETACFACRRFSTLPAHTREQFVEVMSSNLSVLCAAISARRGAQENTYDERSVQAIAVQAYVLVIALLCDVAGRELKEADVAAAMATANTVPGDKKRGARNAASAASGGWNWVNGVLGKLLRSVGVASELDLDALFAPHTVPNEFLQCVASCVTGVLSVPSAAKAIGVKEAAGAALGAVALRHNELEGTAAALAHVAQSHEHGAPIVATVAAIAEERWNDPRLVTALVHEISGVDTHASANAADSAGIKNMATLAIELAEKAPQSVAASFGVLLHHFSGSSPSMRSGLISAVGNLVVRAFAGAAAMEDGGTGALGGDDGHEMAASDAVRAKLRTKQGLLTLLIARARDSSAFTRARVLQTWAFLAANKCIPLGHWTCVSEIARKRMSDKAAIVRRAAMQLLSALLEFNPFGPELSAKTFGNTLRECESKLPVKPHADTAAGADGESNGDGAWSAGAAIPEDDDDSGNDDDDAIEEESGFSGLEGGVEALRALIASLRTAHEFTLLLTDALGTLSKLLQSGTASDVTESISLLVLLSQFGVDDAEDAARRMLPLIFSSDAAARDAVIAALEKLYLCDDPVSGARRLADVAAHASTGEAASLEEALRMMAARRGGQAGGLDMRMVKAVMGNAIGLGAQQRQNQQQQQQKQRNQSAEDDEHDEEERADSYGSLILLAMLTSARPEILNGRVAQIATSTALDATGAAVDDMAIKSALVAVRKSTLARLQSDDSLFSTLEQIILGGSKSKALTERVWYAVAEEAMAVVYALHPDPERHASAILARMAHDVFGTSENPIDGVRAIGLSRLLSMIGIVAIRQLVYIESTAKRIRAENVRRTTAKAEAANSNDTEDGDDEEEDDDIAAQVGGGDAASFDAQVDAVREAVEREIVGGGGRGTTCDSATVIACLAPLVESICEKIAKDPCAFSEHGVVQSSAALTLSRLMAVDEVCCKRCLPILFTILRQAPSPILRSNCIIAVGDLAFRYPNLLEPWTEHIYAPLTDKAGGDAVVVRRSCVMVLSHLILNDMMKVKGYISDLTVCMEDADDVVAGQARLFIHELSKRTGNPIYNLLPDIISRLSSAENLAPDAFQRIMKMLISYVDKEKFQEGLLGKLCARLGAAERTDQRRNLAFCMAQLQVTEKMLLKLTDQFQSYKSALLDTQVQHHILALVTRGKKLSKPEARELAATLEKQISAKAEDALCVSTDEEEAVAEGETNVGTENNSQEADEAKKDDRDCLDNGGNDEDADKENAVKQEGVDLDTDPKRRSRRQRQRQSDEGAMTQTVI